MLPGMVSRQADVMKEYCLGMLPCMISSQADLRVVLVCYPAWFQDKLIWKSSLKYAILHDFKARWSTERIRSMLDCMISRQVDLLRDIKYATLHEFMTRWLNKGVMSEHDTLIYWQNFRMPLE